MSGGDLRIHKDALAHVYMLVTRYKTQLLNSTDEHNTVWSNVPIKAEKKTTAPLSQIINVLCNIWLLTKT